jgi:hypothetical protein
MAALFPPLDGFSEYREMVRNITASANEVLFRVVGDVLSEHRDGRPHRWTPRRVKEACVNFQETLLNERNDFVGRNQETLLHALEADSLAPQQVHA